METAAILESQQSFFSSDEANLYYQSTESTHQSHKSYTGSSTPFSSNSYSNSTLTATSDAKSALSASAVPSSVFTSKTGSSAKPTSDSNNASEIGTGSDCITGSQMSFLVTRPDSTTVSMTAKSENTDDHSISCISNSTISVNVPLSTGAYWPGTLAGGMDIGAPRPLTQGKLVTVGLGQDNIVKGENVYSPMSCNSCMSSNASTSTLLPSAPSCSETHSMSTQTGASLRNLQTKDIKTQTQTSSQLKPAGPSFLNNLRNFLTGGAYTQPDLPSPTPSTGDIHRFVSIRRSSSVGDNLIQHVEKTPKPPTVFAASAKLSRTLSEPMGFCLPPDAFLANGNIQVC